MSPPLLDLSNNAVQFRVAVTPLSTTSLDYQRRIFHFRSVKIDPRLLFPTLPGNFPINLRGESLIWPNRPIVNDSIYNVTEIGHGAMGSVSHDTDKVKSTTARESQAFRRGDQGDEADVPSHPCMFTMSPSRTPIRPLPSGPPP